MRYQLVLQFRGDSLPDYDAMIALEEEMIGVLADEGAVDGHDVGSGETNIFILTDDPQGAFRQAKAVLVRHGSLEQVVAAYRSLDGEDYTVVWPEGYEAAFTIG